MPVVVACPRCQKEINAKRELLGKRISCPYCRQKFPLIANPAPTEKPASHPTPPPTVRFEGSPHPKAARSTVGPASPSPSPPRRPTKTAKFIAADPTVVAIPLNEDGQLPHLVLSAEEKQDENQEQPRAANPWLMAVAVGVSFLLCVVMLLVETPTGGRGVSAKRQKDDARRQIEEFYTGGEDAPLRRYQQVLREAIQAYNRGDEAAEKRRYRQAMDILKAEGHHPYTGLTGQKNADYPPSDRHLEETLSTLLRD